MDFAIGAKIDDCFSQRFYAFIVRYRIRMQEGLIILWDLAHNCLRCLKDALLTRLEGTWRRRSRYAPEVRKRAGIGRVAICLLDVLHRVPLK